MSTELENLLELLSREPDRLEEVLVEFRRIRIATPAEPGSHYNLAAALHGLGRPAEALQVLEEALQLHPNEALLYYGTGCVLQADGRSDDALTAFAMTIDLDSEYADAWYGLGSIFHGYGDTVRALNCFERVLSLQPDHGGARHMRDALAGRTSPVPPGNFVRDLFDSYAGHYDDHLLGDLNYRAPELIGDVLAEVLTAEASLRVLDLGCGTGLSGTRLRTFAELLVGVDVSAGMLAEAEVRGCYDRLEQAEITDYLNTAPTASVDLLTAVDVFSYVGDLEPLIESARRVLKPGGMLAFTVEATDADGVVLTQSGRYRHSMSYLDRLCNSHSYRQLVADPQVIRMEGGTPCRGFVVVWRNRAA